MELFNLPIKKSVYILALGAESAGIFAVCREGSVFVSENFGDLLNESNFLKYKKAVMSYLRKEKIKPDVILTDLHPLFKTTIFGEELAKKYRAGHIKVQHHIAHVFSSVGDKIVHSSSYTIPDTFAGIAMDGTGYGLDENIWGGEVFKISNDKFQMTNQCQNPKSKMKIKRDGLRIERIGSLEEQIMIGGDWAVKEPARMLISILSKFLPKEKVYQYSKKYYSKNEFEALYNQLDQNFNCQTTTSTGRILDAVSVLLGFAGNERNFKHEAVKKLEENSTLPYDDIELRITNYKSRQILNTTYLFEYLIKNIHRDKKRLAATAQLYIAKGLFELIKPLAIGHKPLAIFVAGGLTNNKIISDFLEKKGVYLAKKIPRGDEGIAFGQIIYYLANSRH